MRLATLAHDINTTMKPTVMNARHTPIGRAAEEPVVDWHHPGARVPIRVGMLAGKPVGDAAHLGDCLIDPRVVRYPAEGPQAPGTLSTASPGA